MLSQNNTKTYLLYFAFMAFILSWTLLPTLIRHELPPDLIEAYLWGHPFFWGNDKNPYLPALLVQAGIALGGSSGIGIYFLQSIIVAIGIYSTYFLTLHYAPSRYALVSALSLVACIPYTIELQIFNDNYILMGLLPLASLYFYHAIYSGDIKYWIAGGFILGLATMGKYHAVLLGLALLFFILFNHSKRYLLISYKPYLSFLIFLMVVFPNLYWLYHHQFLTLTYAFQDRGNFQQTHWLSSVKHNLFFLWTNFLSFAPSLILMLLAMSKGKIHLANRDHEKQSFLFWVGLGPLCLLFLMSLCFNLTLHREWGTGFYGLINTYLLISLRANITEKSFKRFIYSLLFVLCLYPILYLYFSYEKHTGTFPAKKISQMGEALWEKHFNSPLSYVAGDRFTAGYLGLYTNNKPTVWMEWNKRISPDLSLKNLKCLGALFIIESGHTTLHLYKGKDFPPFVLEAFPTLQVIGPFSIPWERNNTRAPVSVTFGLLPPNIKMC